MKNILTLILLIFSTSLFSQFAEKPVLDGTERFPTYKEVGGNKFVTSQSIANLADSTILIEGTNMTITKTGNNTFILSAALDGAADMDIDSLVSLIMPDSVLTATLVSGASESVSFSPLLDIVRDMMPEIFPDTFLTEATYEANVLSFDMNIGDDYSFDLSGLSAIDTFCTDLNLVGDILTIGRNYGADLVEDLQGFRDTLVLTAGDNITLNSAGLNAYTINAVIPTSQDTFPTSVAITGGATKTVTIEMNYGADITTTFNDLSGAGGDGVIASIERNGYVINYTGVNGGFDGTINLQPLFDSLLLTITDTFSTSVAVTGDATKTITIVRSEGTDLVGSWTDNVIDTTNIYQTIIDTAAAIRNDFPLVYDDTFAVDLTMDANFLLKVAMNIGDDLEQDLSGLLFDSTYVYEAITNSDALTGFLIVGDGGSPTLVSKADTVFILIGHYGISTNTGPAGVGFSADTSELATQNDINVINQTITDINVDDADSDPTNELDDTDVSSFSIVGSQLVLIEDANTFEIEVSEFGDGNTQLTEAQVDNFVANNGYITNANDADFDPTNELNEFFSQNTEPAGSAQVSDIWYQPIVQRMYTYDGAGWQSISSRTIMASITPVTTVGFLQGDFWINGNIVYVLAESGGNVAWELLGTQSLAGYYTPTITSPNGTIGNYNATYKKNNAGGWSVDGSLDFTQAAGITDGPILTITPPTGSDITNAGSIYGSGSAFDFSTSTNYSITSGSLSGNLRVLLGTIGPGVTVRVNYELEWVE